MTHSPDQAGAANPGGDPTISPMYDVLNTMNDDAAAPDGGAGLHTFAPETADAVVNFLETRGFVREPPTLQQVLAHAETRQDPLTFNRDYRATAVPEQATEAEALQELDALLTSFRGFCAERDDMVDRIMAERTQELQEGLFFLGRQEYEEGIAGLAQLWRSYLEADDRARIFVPIDDKYVGPNYRTSARILLDAIMRHFPEDDPLQARIHSGRSIFGMPGQMVRVILLEDWVNSGSAIADANNSFVPPNCDYEVEVNVLAASARQLRDGIELPDPVDRGRNVSIPALAYFNAGKDVGSDAQGGPLVTGAHRAGGREFTERVDYIARTLRRERPETETLTPGLIRIRQAYS